MVIAIFGMGLIGGSLGRAIIKKTEHTVLGCDINVNSMLKAKLLLACNDEINDTNIATADIVVLAMSPNAAIGVMKSVVHKLKDDAIVIDCCGNKRKIVAEMALLQQKYQNINFVGVHPMAGREFSGIAHSVATMFERAYIIMTPVHTPIKQLMAVKQFFIDIGCEGIVVATAEKHDKLISYTSQLAHIISSSYIRNPLSAEHIGFSAGSFRDLTRVAKLDPTMWTELFLENKDNLIEQIEILQKNIQEYKSALEQNDTETLKILLEDGVKKKEYAESLRNGK